VVGEEAALPVHIAAHRLLVWLRNRHLVQRTLRSRAARHLDRLQPGGVTIVVTSWNSDPFLTVCLAAVRRFADRPVEMFVIDNHSRHNPRRIAEQAGARYLRLPANGGHSFALDIGFLLARTEFAIALDVDAFPFSPDWLPTMLGPLDRGYTVVGPEWNGYAHPCCLAMRTERFVRRGYTFAADARRNWDVAEGISVSEGPQRVFLLPKLGNLLGDEAIGATYAGGIYHNAYATRHLRLSDPEEAVLDGKVRRGDALSVWEQALARYGPPTWED
jgi:glycosyltransferase involved in cell wall biosynthesis